MLTAENLRLAIELRTKLLETLDATEAALNGNDDGLSDYSQYVAYRYTAALSTMRCCLVDRIAWERAELKRLGGNR